MQYEFFLLLVSSIRFAIIGQLVLLSILGFISQPRIHAISLAIFAIGLSSYLLLTLPIPNSDYPSLLRGILLFFTELIAFQLWVLMFALVFGAQKLQQIPRLAYVVLGIALTYFFYFFVFQQGRGLFHQAVEVVQLGLMIHVIYLAIHNLNDDLVDVRRKLRVFIAGFIAVYFSILILFELADSSLRDTQIFVLGNSVFMFLATTFFACFVLKNRLKAPSPHSDLDKNTLVKKENSNSELVIPSGQQALLQQLTSLMDSGFYRNSNLTIGELSQQLSVQEYILRQTINQQLGYRNFSSFLNHYRIQEACQLLSTPNLVKTPILTIALELGYGSIAPFNRAFKEKMGVTPSEFRQNH